MIHGVAIQAEARKMSRADFLARYPHPFLVREVSYTESGPPSAPTATSPGLPTPDTRNIVFSGSAPPSSRGSALSGPPKSVPPPPSVSRISTRLYLYPDRYELLPVQKREDRPAKDPVLIGRSPNNDIIFRDPSVSKLHAHLERDVAGFWTLVAKKTVNGTFVDGRLIDVGDSVPVKSGSALQFGNVHCELLEAGPLFDLFVH